MTVYRFSIVVVNGELVQRLRHPPGHHARVTGAQPSLIGIIEHEAVQNRFLSTLQEGLAAQGLQSRVAAGTYAKKHAQ